MREANNRCETCHSDHKGRAYPLIRWSPPATFDHAKDAGFALTGSHASAPCGACHKDRPAYMGAKTTCAGCHTDAHKGELGATCESCHDTTSFVPARGFDHARTKFPLTDRHTTVACASCHARDGTGRVDYDVQGFERCSTCHGDPHRGKTALSPCTDCHTTRGWREVAAVPPAHSPAGWPLVGEHAGVACADCHGADLSAKVSTSCASCHTDAHQGRFGKDCERCHDESGWRHLDMGRFDHARTRYPLEGAHATVRCESCHKKSAGRVVYRGLPFDRCDRCHRGWHEQAELATVASVTACESCHTVRGFTPSTFTTTRHEGARMALDGSHLAAPCELCHIAAPKKPTPLAIGAEACAGCHQDPHGGQFDAQMAAGASCAACHATAGWSQGSFDHDRTAFPLRGVHADAACASCHRGDPIQYEGLATACVGCHQDLHQGQFSIARAAATAPSPEADAHALRPLEAKDCPTCHDDKSFRIDPFDHLARTGFTLSGQHAALACPSCHDARALGDEVGADVPAQVVHYRLGYDRCEDCHANPHTAGSWGGARHPDVPDLGTGCAKCHVDSSWQQITNVSFDHALTGFALVGEHARATCDQCHGRPLRTDEARAACVTCHDDPHRGEQGASCESCHDPSSWTPSNALLRHRGTRFPLVGMHAAADCTACHDRLRQDTWRATPSECFACHAEEYRREDVHPNHVTARFDRACDTCHSQATWMPARIDHDVYWPLRGAHATSDCFQCHAGDRYGGTPKACVDCHRDDYDRTSDPPHASFGIETRCERCHEDLGWSTLRSSWHERSFPIRRGDHAGLACTDCHAPGSPPQAFDCIGCHGRDGTDREHRGVGGYVWASQACYGCHPKGDD
ncbi:MAG: hypothetical protein IT385_27100 [Deltaproteobacteria bacterium]|nr:hypothetical protein [Deltaproteobacteria bacterium]